MGTVQSIDRAFAVLRQVAHEPGGITDVARAVDLPVSTVARLLTTLESQGAVVRLGDTGTWGIGSGIRDLAAFVDPAWSLVARAQSVLAALVERTGETSGLSVIDGDEVVYLDHVETRHEVTLRDWTGTRLPLHVVSSGLVMLAALPPERIEAYVARPLAAPTGHTVVQPARIRQRLARVRREGFAWTVGEFDEGIASVAAPVVDARGNTVAAIHTHGPSYRFPGDADPDAIAAQVRDAARTLSQAQIRRPGP